MVFAVIDGLDWVATVPPTIALCREVSGENGAVVFGWVFAAHQVGAALAAFAAGYVRDLARCQHHLRARGLVADARG